MGRDASVVQVEIFGQTYNLRSDGDPSYIISLAAHVDEKMREVARETKAVDTLRVAILAALNIADEGRRGAPAQPATDAAAPTNGKAGRKADAGAGEIERRTAEWVRILDEAIGG